jgi:hypothetical protein
VMLTVNSWRLEALAPLMLAAFALRLMHLETRAQTASVGSESLSRDRPGSILSCSSSQGSTRPNNKLLSQRGVPLRDLP